MRLGIFGGSFDPVHYGHLLLAECCLEQQQLDQVWFMPAAEPPHKQGAALSGPTERLEMLSLAIAGHEQLQVSSLEIDRGGISFTADTLRQLRAEHLDAELFFLMGGDSLYDLPHWREPAEILSLAMPIVMARPDWPEPDFNTIADLVTPERLAQIRNHRIEAPLIDISSTDIRSRVVDGRSIRFRTPRAVEAYIEAQGLYRACK